MGDVRGNFCTATSNILLSDHEELVYWWGDWEDSNEFYTTEAGTQKTCEEKLCQSVKKKRDQKRKMVQ